MSSEFSVFMLCKMSMSDNPKSKKSLNYPPKYLLNFCCCFSLYFFNNMINARPKLIIEQTAIQNISIVLVWAATTKIIQIGRLKQQKSVYQSSGDWLENPKSRYQHI